MPQYNEGFTSKFILEGCHIPLPRCKERALCSQEIRSGCDRDPLACEVYVQRATTMIMEDIGMTPLREASVEFIHPKDPSKNGASAVTIICESHGGGHSWGEAGAFRFVVDSCKVYDVTRVADMLCFLFNPIRCTVWVEEKEALQLSRFKQLKRIHRRVEFQGSLISKLAVFLKRGGGTRECTNGGSG